MKRENMFSEELDNRTLVEASLEYLARKMRRRRVMRRVLAVLCVIVLVFTSYSMKMTATTLERVPTCGLPDHEHTHEQGCYDEADNLICE